MIRCPALLSANRTTQRDCLRIGAEPVLAAFALHDRENEEDDSADQWNHSDEQPPSAASDVVQPPHGNREPGYEGRDHVECCENAKADGFVRDARHRIEDDEAKRDEDGEEREHPVFGPARAAGENRVLLQYRQIPTHRVLPSKSTRPSRRRSRRASPVLAYQPLASRSD